MLTVDDKVARSMTRVLRQLQVWVQMQLGSAMEQGLYYHGEEVGDGHCISWATGDNLGHRSGFTSREASRVQNEVEKALDSNDSYHEIWMLARSGYFQLL